MIMEYIFLKNNFILIAWFKSFVFNFFSKFSYYISKNKIIYNKKREVLEIDENLLIEDEEDLSFV